MVEIYYRVPKEELEEIYKFHFEYNAGNRTRYMWEWEYGVLNPQKALLLAIKIDNKVIATQGMLPVKVAFGKDIYLTGKNESLLIDSAYRGKSLSTRLYNYAIDEYEKENISCLWGFSSKAIIPLSKAKFKIFEGVMKRMILSINYKQAKELIPRKTQKGLKGAIVKIVVLFATLYSSFIFYLLKKQKTKNTENYEVTEDLKNSDDIINLYKQLVHIYPELIYIYPDKEFFNWRIRKAPYPIKTNFLYKGGELKGYFYLTVKEKYVELTDFSFLDNKDGNILIKEFIKVIEKNGYGFIYYTGNSKNKLNKRVLNLLANFGFLKMKGPSHFVLRNFSFNNEERLFNIENWYLNELWSEGN